MSKARDLADFISTGSILSDGTIESTEISGVTADATEINKLDGLTADTTELNTLDGVTATTAELNKLAGTTATTADFDKLSNVTASATELNYMTGATSSIQSQLDNISVTSGSLTKSFTNGESATITLAQSISPAPVVDVVREIPQSGVSSKGKWDVDATASNYDLHNTAYNTTLTPSNASADGTFTLGTGSFASTDVGKQIEGNGGVAILTGTNGSYSIVTNFTDTSAIASGSWSMSGIKSAGASTGLSMAGLATSGDYSVIESANGHVSSRSLGNHLSGGNKGFSFSDNGLYLYAVDTSGDTIYRWTLTTAWDLSTCPAGATDSLGPLTSSYDGGPVDVAVGNDGNSLFMLGQDGDRIFQWSLSQPYVLSGASFVTSISVQGAATANGGLNGFHFRPDGTDVYFVDRNTDRVSRYSMSSPWSISSATLTSTLNLTGVDTFPNDVTLSNDGTEMYVAGDNDKLRKWNLSTAWDITTATLDTTFNKTTYLGNNPSSATGGLFLKPDETRLYMMSSGDIVVYQFNIGDITQPTSQYHIGVTNTAGQIASEYWTDINSMTADQTLGDYGEAYYAVSTDDRTTWSIAKGTEGVRPIVRNNAGTWQYNTQTVTSGYGIENITEDGVTFSAGSYETSIETVLLNNDGTKMYIIGSNGDDITEFGLSTAYDVSTASLNSTFSLGSQMIAPRGGAFSPDGTVLWITGESNIAGQPGDGIWQYTLTTGFDVSTASYSGTSRNLSTLSGSPAPRGGTFNNDGTKYFFCNYDNSRIYEYRFSTGYDLSSFTTDSSKDVSSQDSIPIHILFNDDGTKLFLLGANSYKIFQYSLSTPYLLNSATYDSVFFDLSAFTGQARLGAWNADGTKLIIADDDNVDTIETISTEIQSYTTSATWTNATTNDEFYALQEALGDTPVNRMDKTQLDAIPDGSHFTLGNTLDLMIALKQDTAAITVPSSDGVTINYDAATINQGAVRGTDYDFDFPANNKVRITSNAAQNLKIRVV